MPEDANALVSGARRPPLAACRPPRPRVPCFGDRRFIPRAAHLRADRTRWDDLESWLLLAADCFDSKFLPWTSEVDLPARHSLARLQTSLDAVREKKEAFFGAGAEGMAALSDGRENGECLRRLAALVPELPALGCIEEPDYAKFRAALRDLRALVPPPTDEFSWKEAPVGKEEEDDE